MAVTIPNQWSASFFQPASFQTMPPELQSVIVPLNNTTSVGGGSGTPTAGNWLFCLVGMNEQAATAGFTVGIGDDIHSFWRPGNETTSTWAVSTSSALTRTAAWYTANTARVVSDVYIAPNGAFDAMTVLVVEVAGLGPWDTVAGINTNYAAAATSLSLALGAPSAQALIIGAVSGDLSTATQAFAPASWTGLQTVTVTNGSDHTCDSVLTSAYIVTSGSVSVSGTAVSASDLSGVLISVLTAATSPIPASQNPNWPYLKFEGAFGGGFQTPPDQLTWTDLTNRLWSWSENTGIQFELGQIQATELNLELDNFDNLLGSDNPASYFYTAAGTNWHPSSAFYDTLVAAPSPLAWWKLNDASGASSAADSSGNSHSATATSVTFGNTSQAVTGNNSASFASASSSHALSTYNPSFSTGITVEAWVNLNGLSQGGNNPRLVANGHTDSDNKGFQLMVTSARQPQFWVGNGTLNGNAAGGTVPTSGWTHIVGTYDGTTVSIYVNGILQTASGFTGTVTAGLASGIGLGYNPTYSGDYLNGLLAECAVYGTALSASQVAAHYTAGPNVTGTPLRIRAALGTIGGQTVNRWYVIQRNAEQWPQQVDTQYRRRVGATATDIWSVLSSFGPSPYRGEIQQDNPGWWWPMDDQPLTGGVQPTTLRNAGTSSTVMNIIASPNGVTAGAPYSTTGSNLSSIDSGAPPPNVAVYAVGQQQGWMYGDPQSSFQSYSTGNPVTSNPGSAAWQQTGAQGNTGANGWFLSANDATFPSLTGGITIKGWFNAEFFGSGAGWVPVATVFDVAGQPATTLTICTLTSNSAPIAKLQFTTGGTLNLLTYNAGTPTTHAIYSTSDLRSASWQAVDITLTASSWAVYVNGGLTASVSGSATISPTAWTYLILNGDMGTSGGGTTSAIVNGGNSAYSHWAVYSSVLPAWRIRAHYCAAITAFGLLPAPVPSLTAVLGDNYTAPAPVNFTPDGSYDPITNHPVYGNPNGTPSGITSFTMSALVTANAGSFTSGPSPRVTTVGIGQDQSSLGIGYAIWVSWTGLAPLFTVYTSATANNETAASTVAGSGDAYSNAYGSSAVGHGVCETAAGSGASPPASASALGDTVQQRLERILAYANAIYPGRCIDPASLAVQAATDIGGQQTGQNLINITQSDGGLLAVDNLGNLIYFQKSHLASQYSSPAWTLSPTAPPTPGASSTAIPYYRDFDWSEDPQRIFNSILITPFSPDGSSLADITPSQSVQVNASQAQYGAQPRQITSYLQSQTEMTNQANWLFGYFGQSQIRADNVRIDAAPYPAAFPMVLGVNVGDVVTMQNWQIGGGSLTDTFRVTQIQRTLAFGGDDGEDGPRAEIILQLDPEPASYWS